mgnify:CR=1 FL=1
MDENNNFFNFVSKIGSLINNKTKEKDAKKNNKGSAKKYNIKISTDDEQTLENIDNQDDEEEEEEEDEKEEQKQEEKVEGKKEENKINDQSEKEKEKDKEKIQNLVKEIMDNNDKDNNNDEDDEDKEEEINNINNINDDSNNNKEEIKNYNNIYCSPILNNSFPVINCNGNAENGAVIFVYDDTTSCHIMLKKGNDFNIYEYNVIPILFLEKQKNIFYKMGMTNIPSYEPVKYLFFFDEHYLYFAKDEIIFLETDEETRRINKIVSLYDIKDFTTENENDNFLIKLIVKKDEFKEKEVSFYIEQKYFSGFMKNFNLKLSIFGIDFFSNKNKN